jgi:hypothetical protein
LPPQNINEPEAHEIQFGEGETDGGMIQAWNSDGVMIGIARKGGGSGRSTTLNLS